MTKEEAITIIKNYKAQWQMLLRENLCDETEGKKIVEAFDMALSALKEEFAPFDFELFQAGLMDIPDGMTNGEVIMSLYPDLKYTIQNGRVVTTIGVASSFDLEWWNAPHKKGGK